MAFKTVAEEKAYSEMIEAQAQEYKRSEAYLRAVAEKRKREGKTPLPAPRTGDVYGTQEQIRDRLIKQYESGAIPQDVSAEIVENKERPGQYSVYFSETPGYMPGKTDSIIRYYSHQEVQQPLMTPSGEYTYEVGVEHPEQVRDVRIWAAAHGLKSKRVYPDEDVQGQAPIIVQVYSKEKLPEDTNIDIRTVETIQSEKLGKVMGRKIYEEASPIEKVGLHVRTALSPAGWGYVGAAVREHGDPVTRAVIDLAFPGIKSTGEVVVKDIEQRVARRARGETTYNIMGFDIDERIVSAFSNPIVEVEMMALGGAAAAKVASTHLGAKILGSMAGKIASLGIAGGYVIERGSRVVKLRAEGKPEEALGTLATTVGGFAAGGLAFRAEYSHIINSRAVVNVDVSKIKGASLSKQVGKDTTVSRGKFQISEGRLKGLRGETVSISGKKGGLITTKIPAQKIGSGAKAIRIQEQVFHSYTEHGVISNKLKISWRKAGDYLLRIKAGGASKSKVVGPTQSKTLIQEISRTQTKLTASKTLPGGKLSKSQEVIVRRFSGIGSGTTAKKYDLYVIQKGDKLLIAQSSVVSGKHLAKLDWVDISPVKTSGTTKITGTTPPGLKLTGTGKTTVTQIGKTVGKTAVTTPPPVPPTSMSIKVQPAQAAKAAGTMARIIPNVNPVQFPLRIKETTSPEKISIPVGIPMIIRRESTDLRKGREVEARPKIAMVSIPAIIRKEDAGEKAKVKTVVTGAQISIATTHPISGQAVTPKERQAVLRAIEPIIDRVPSQPIIPVIPPATTPPPIIIPPPGLFPYLQLGPAKFNIDKYMRGVKTNPVPDIRKLI